MKRESPLNSARKTWKSYRIWRLRHWIWNVASGAELDIEIAKKRDKLNTENGNAIKSGMAKANNSQKRIRKSKNFKPSIKVRNFDISRIIKRKTE